MVALPQTQSDNLNGWLAVVKKLRELKSNRNGMSKLGMVLVIAKLMPFVQDFKARGILAQAANNMLPQLFIPSQILMDKRYLKKDDPDMAKNLAEGIKLGRAYKDKGGSRISLPIVLDNDGWVKFTNKLSKDGLLNGFFAELFKFDSSSSSLQAVMVKTLQQELKK